MTQDINSKAGTNDVVWQLKDLYTSISDETIEKDLQTAKKNALEIREKYAGHLAELDAQKLFELVKSLEEVSETIGKIGAFAYLNFSVNTEDPSAGAFLQRIKEETSQITKELVFFELEWANLDDKHSEILLSDEKVSRYEHYLRSLRRYRPHLLSEVEERLLVEISPVGKSSWVNLFDKVLTFQRYGPDKRTQEEVLKDLYMPDRQVREKASQELTEGLKDDLLVITHTFNTILADKMIGDKLRKYPTWISSMNLANELEDETVNALIQSVTNCYPTVERYYNLKKKILGLEELYDFDRYAPLPWLPQRFVSWSQAKDIVLEAFSDFSPKVAEIAQRFFEKKWIHAPILPGKTSGAFAHPVTPSSHPFILVNFAGTLRDVETLAHELGHGVHQVLASKKGYFNSDTPLTLAETASVFGEMLVFRKILEDLSDSKEKLGLIAAKIESIFATVFRQIAMNRFEDAIHNHRRQKGELSVDDFSNYWIDTQQAMFGNSVTLTDNYKIWWSYISHFLHVPGYVYSYAFGELLVLSLYALYQEQEEGFTEKYISLLEAGGSDTPYNLLKPFGIDISQKDFWLKGLKIIDNMVGEAENLAREIA